MQSSSLVVSSFSLLLASTAIAQGDGWAPPVHQSRGGNNGFAMPGNWSVGRVQEIIARTDLPAAFNTGNLLTKLQYRRTAYASILNTAYAAKVITSEVSVGNTTTPGNGLVTTWATNRPADLSVVLPLGAVNLPNDPPIGAFQEVGPDIMIFPFAAPKLYMGGNLFIEHVNNAGGAGAATTYWSDALDNTAAIINGHNAVRGRFGCGAVAGTPTTLRAPTSASGNALGGSTTYTLASATASTAFLATIGFELTNPYGVPAPFDLAAIGAPGCPLWNTLDILITGTTSAAGGGTFTVAWPADPSIARLEVGIQTLVISLGFNAANLTTSNGIDAWIGGRYNMTSAQVLEFNNLASAAAPATGLYVGALPITHLFWL
jgi:hypothetical protein